MSGPGQQTHGAELIYLDHNATTPLDPRVLEVMLPCLTHAFGNAASPHAMGCAAHGVVETARGEVAALLGADPREIVWTSGATESNNLAILGVCESPHYESAGKSSGRARHVVTVRTEHAAVLDPCRELSRRGFRVHFVGVDVGGIVDLEALDRAVQEDTLLVSVMLANNETGVMQPIGEVSRIARSRGALLHCDATQAVGKVPVDVDTLGVDLLSLSAHKLYGPKGTGALYVRRRAPRVRLHPRHFGGGHERDMRSGTLNVPGIVGLGAACAIARREMAEEAVRVSGLRDRLERALLEIAGTARNGATEHRLPNTTNLSFGDRDAKEIIRRTPALCVSTASACTSAQLQPSHVLGAMGLSDERIGSSLRFSLGRGTTEAEIDRAAEMVKAAIAG